MIIYFANRMMNILGHASTNLQEGYVIKEDLKTEDIETGVATFTCRVGYTADSRQQLETMMEAGNYILRKNDCENEFYTIIDVEIDTEGQDIYVYAEDAGLDLLNEIAEAYEATEAHTAEWYINKYIKDSGFEIGVNEIPANNERKLSWEGESTVTERLSSIATKFDGFEISYTFDIKGTSITNKYVNIYKKRGKDVGAKLRLNYDIDRIITKKSVANIATALRVFGGTPEDSETPVTLQGYDYDDGDFWIGSDGALRSREANRKWSRYIWNKEPNKLDGYGGHIFRTYTYDTTNQKVLLSHAIAELKKLREMEVNYEVDIAKLPDGIKVGDRVDIIDHAGKLYMSSRILMLETSITNATQTATIGESLVKNSGISTQMEEIAAKFSENVKDTEKAKLIAEAAKNVASEAKDAAEKVDKGLQETDQDLAATISRVDSVTKELTSSMEKNYQKTISKGEQLVTNGSGLMGDNTNFSKWSFDGAVSNNSPGSFTDNGSGFRVTDEFFPISADKEYTFSFDIKSKYGLASLYSMLVFYDADKNIIYATNHVYNSNSTTRLAQDLKSGDTVIYLENLQGWDTEYSHGYAMLAWNYLNSFGYIYPAGTISKNRILLPRNGSFLKSECLNRVNNTILLENAYEGKTIPAGTEVSQGGDGNTYKYFPVVNAVIGTEWKRYRGKISGIDYSGKNMFNKFPPGVAYAKVGFQWNYNHADDQLWITNVSVTDTTVTSATQSAVDEMKKTIPEKYATKSEIKQTESSIITSVKAMCTTKDEFECLEIGGRNLLKDSRHIKLYSNNSNSYPVISEIMTEGEREFTRYQRTNTTMNPTVMSLYSNIPLSQVTENLTGVECTFSCLARCSHSVRTALEKSLSIDGAVYIIGSETVEVDIGNDWCRIYASGTIVQEYDAEKKGNYLRFNPHYIKIPEGEIDDFYIDICEWKIEKGNKATDWTPAPEDMATTKVVKELSTRVTQTEDSIKSQATSIDSMGSRMSTVEQTAEGLTVSLEETKKNISIAQDTAENAAKTATNYLNFSNLGLLIGDMTAETLGKNVLIDSDSVNIRNGTAVLATFGSELIELGKDSESAVISLCGGNGTISFGVEDGMPFSSSLYLKSAAGLTLKSDNQVFLCSKNEDGYAGLSLGGSHGSLFSQNIAISATDELFIESENVINLYGEKDLILSTEYAVHIYADDVIVSNNLSLCSEDANGVIREIMRLNSSASTPTLILGDGLYSASIGAVNVSAGSTVRLLTANERVIFESVNSTTNTAYFRPNNDAKCSLGTSAKRWYAVYASNSTVQTSDKREKENIMPLGNDLITIFLEGGKSEVVDLHSALFDRLEPVQYNFINGNKKTCYGLIAQDVIGIMHELDIGEDSLDLVHHEFWNDSETGEITESFGIAYTNLIPLLIYEVQKLKKEIAALKEV